MSNKLKYTLYLVTRSATHHYPVIMSHNGKPCLNEPVKKKAVLQLSMERFLDAAYKGSEQVGIVRLSEAEFRKQHPKFPVNAGPKKKATKAKEASFRKGQKVKVDAGIWGKCEAVVKERDPKFEDLYYLTITKGAHKGSTGRYDHRHITPR
jgi:transcription antitermination factor NusG